jgi:hypothetical protein
MSAICPREGPRHPLFGMSQDMLRGTQIARIPCLDRKGTLRRADRLAAGNDDSSTEAAGADEVVMMLMSLAMLQERFRPSS